MILGVRISDRADLADELGISLQFLTYILYSKRPENCYRSFEIPKSSGGVRHINAPNDDLKYIHSKLAKLIWNHIKQIREQDSIRANLSHAFEKGKSIFTNARIHQRKRYVINVDLKDFFDSFNFGRVLGFFEKNRYFMLNHEMATVFAQLTCYKNCLPQGAPTSPIITNLICEILDIRLLNLAKSYRLDYTRYADDLTFSTNDKNIINRFDDFYNDLNSEIERAGFKINTDKTRVLYKNSRQNVTGLVVNKKINIDRRYYKKVRAMTNNLYRNGSFTIDGKPGTVNQLGGMLSFINQVEINNEKINGEPDIKKEKNRRDPSKNYSAKENLYREFLFYTRFFNSPKPVIITEGKTDIIYLKCAMKKLYKDYPLLIQKTESSFSFKVSFFNRSNTLGCFFGKTDGGAIAYIDIAKEFSDNKSTKSLYTKLAGKSSGKPLNPVIMVFDNEYKSKEKPLRQFLNCKGVHDLDVEPEKLINGYMDRVFKNRNLYFVTHQSIGKGDSEIENLFSEDTRNHKISEKGLSLKKDAKKNGYYGKADFANYVKNNYASIDFSGFRPLLDYIVKAIESYADINTETQNDAL